MTTQILEHPEPAPTASPWPLARRLTWVLLLGLTFYVYGVATLGAFSPPEHMITDLFQEWASAKNYFRELPLYRPHRETAWEYMQYRHDPKEGGVFVEINGHPPPAVLVTLPLVMFDYRTACTVWNALSAAAFVAAIWLIVPNFLGRKFSWPWLIALCLLISNPTLQHLRMSQWAMFLLLMIAGAYRADQRGMSRLAGVLVGTAAAFKLFPAFLLVYFFMKRDWRAVISGVVTFVLWNLASLAVFGFDDYGHYVRYALPALNKYRDSWANYSVVGFWYRLFDGTSKHAVPLWYSPMLAQLLSLLSQLAVLMLVLRQLRRAPAEHRVEDFALTVSAMIFLSPIVWDHYMLLFLLPGLVIARWLPRAVLPQVMFRVALFVMWLNPLFVWLLITMNKPTAEIGAKEIVLAVSWPFYAVLIMLILNLAAARVPNPAEAMDEIGEGRPRWGGTRLDWQPQAEAARPTFSQSSAPH